MSDKVIIIVGKNMVDRDRLSSECVKDLQEAGLVNDKVTIDNVTAVKAEVRYK